MRIDRSFPDTLKYHIENIESFIYEGEAQGYKFIELRLIKQCTTQDILMGVDELKLATARRPGQRMAVTTGGHIIKDGVLRFFPDKRLYRWGYMLDTPKNRKWLAAQLATPQVIISDPKIHEEIVKLAEELNIDITPKEIDVSFDNYLVGKTVEKDDDKEELLRKIAELEGKLEEKNSKPLSGKRVTKKEE